MELTGDAEVDALLDAYEFHYTWRARWNALAMNVERMRRMGALQSQMEYIERRAKTANWKIAKIFQALDELRRSRASARVNL